MIAADTQIDGGGLVTLDEQDAMRIFSVAANVQFDLTGITLSNGAGVTQNGSGGAIFVDVSDTLTLTISTLSNNSGSISGGIRTDDDNTVTLTNGTLSGNSAGGNGGTIYNDDENTVTITNSMLSDNSAGFNGGGISRPQGPDCDIGSVEVRPASTYPLCASYYTGAVTSPLSGGCGAGTIEIEPYDQTFCLNMWTGQVHYLFGRPCNPPRVADTLPDDGDLLICVSYYTGANRWVMNYSQSRANKLPNAILATG